MPRESKKAAASKPTEKTLEQLMLDVTSGKYSIVGMASVWALELHRREEYRHLTQAELLDLALNEVLTGKVDQQEIRKVAVAAAQAAIAANSKEKK